MAFTFKPTIKAFLFFISLLAPGASSALYAINDEIIPSLRSIVLNGDSVIELPSAKDLIISYKMHDIILEMEAADTMAYQFLLEGYDKKWSPWVYTGYKEYTNLPSGKYRLRVRYTDMEQNAGELSLISFKVLPLWYFSAPGIFFYLCLAALLIWTLYTQLNLRFARTQHMLEQIINNRTEDLIIEKEKTEALLNNVLPRNTASEIMLTGKAAKMKYNFVTVLFSDIQGFTKIAEETNPEVLIDELDKFFFYFDSVVERLGIEKIKTIGDAYMCAGGIPEKNRTNPVEVILAALEMQVYMSRLKESSEVEGMRFWDIRIGIHTGTVVAGVVGHKKLSYDIWGDTVNTASRMESSGEAGKINISGTTYEFVKDFFICEHRGKMPVKYKGELDMYFVSGIIPELRDEESKPNEKFILKMQMIKLHDVEELIIKMFDDEAPPNLYFHNSAMVRNISSQADLLTTAEKLPDEDYLALRLASLFLYTGYITDYDNPMEASFCVAVDILPTYGFSRETIEQVRNLICNSFNNNYKSLSDNILHDARFDYLGRVDYLRLTDKLFREESEYGISNSDAQWKDKQRRLLIDHEFLTDTGRLLRNIPVEDQIGSLLSGVQ